jgi:hypothetical protein
VTINGSGGTVTLSREWPTPAVVSDERLTQAALLRLEITEPGFWSGDRVILSSPLGVPLDITNTGYANCPGGHAIYPGGGLPLGPSRDHCSTMAAQFYPANMADSFYETPATVGFTPQVAVWLHRDELDRCTFFRDEISAVNNDGDERIDLEPVDFGSMVIAIEDGANAYRDALAAAAATVAGRALADGEQPLEDLIPLPAVIASAGTTADARGWRRQCDLTGWVFETDATNLDSTAIGEEFGEGIKGLIRGAGSFTADVSNTYGLEEQAAEVMLKLVLLTGKGREATARFLLADGNILHGTADAPVVARQLYYETQILLGKTSLNVKPREAITLSAEFIATGRIRYTSGADSTNPVPPNQPLNISIIDGGAADTQYD